MKIPPRQAVNAYLRTTAITAPPVDSVIIIFDAALQACQQRELQRTTECLNALRGTLDFQRAPEAADACLRLFLHCADLAHDERFDDAYSILNELRSAWIQVKNQGGSGSS